jgi:hypothetical protein
MRLYQPVMFVGLGGTGCDVGAELERRLREEICGPDGNDFRRQRHASRLLPYQLPSCIQFVYADMNQAELDRLPRRVVPGVGDIPAVAQTARYTSALVPALDSYPDLARSLRILARRETETWLPPQAGEPRVYQLRSGAGQLPTVGRAVLFGSVMDGVSTLLRDIQIAAGRLSTSGEDLSSLGGRPPRGVDVFVAFSVAGGTGAGIFYDYLHLIDFAFADISLRARIWPLVLLPSAFERGQGGGRSADLNAAQALLDLFRLVDQQNAADVELELWGMRDRQPIRSEEVSVQYPVTGRVMMRPGTAQTGILFSRPPGATMEDLHRMIASLVISLVGTEADLDGGETTQSFSDSFLNATAHRQVRAGNGIGNRGVSTATFASLTVPADELAGIVGARLLRNAIEQLSAPPTQVESNLGDMEKFLINAGVHPILMRAPNAFAEPPLAHGARNVAKALNNRLEAMRVGAESLRAQLGRDVPQIADRFDPEDAIRELLRRMDIFRAQRIVFGQQGLPDEFDRTGAAGLLHRRRATPPLPNDSLAPPPVPELRDRFLRSVRWTDAGPAACRTEQDEWYLWLTNAEWAKAWDACIPRWRRPLERAERNLTSLTQELLLFADNDRERFERRSAELYKKRVGVSYLLPATSGRMDQFYEQVVARLAERHYLGDQARLNPSEAGMLQAIVGPDAWGETYKMSIEHGPQIAVSYLLERVKATVKRFLRESLPGEPPMLPRLADLLAEAAGQNSDFGITSDYLDEFKRKLSGLLPPSFTPQGSGPLKVLVSYPADAMNPIIEEYLKSSINLSAGVHDFRHAYTESVSILLFRTGMGITDVGEVRDLLRLWAVAAAWPQQTDMLRWRQRTGYEVGYLATREEHRVEILHRILCALWNGKGAVQGTTASPDELTIDSGDGVTMLLPLTSLTALGQASSWGSLLRAYELWGLDDNEIHRLFCSQLMRELPEGLDALPVYPHPLYMTIREMAAGQIELLDEMMKQQAIGQRARAAQLRAFWAETLPGALNLPFAGAENPAAINLLELENVVV